MSKNEKLIIAAFLVLAFIILPTGTPEDVFTTIPIINAIGITNFALLSLILIIILEEIKKR